ncbi:MAG: amino acid ABC transporter substrate-binding protein, partial [Acidocella sp. 20-61-6]
MSGAGAAAMLGNIPLALADALSDIIKSGVVRIAVPQDFPPFGSVGTDMQPQGYDIDMSALVAAKLG